eukprot:scaffold140010_cov154-Phaeocystis_antarctica.AAC.3
MRHAPRGEALRARQYASWVLPSSVKRPPGTAPDCATINSTTISSSRSGTRTACPRALDGKHVTRDRHRRRLSLAAPRRVGEGPRADGPGLLRLGQPARARRCPARSLAR